MWKPNVKKKEQEAPSVRGSPMNAFLFIFVLDVCMSGCLHADFFYWASLRRLCQAALRPIAHFLLDICVCYGSAMEVKCFSFLLTHERKTGMLRAFHIDHILEIEGK